MSLPHSSVFIFSFEGHNLVFCSLHMIREICFLLNFGLKTSTGIVKYESRVVKSNPDKIFFFLKALLYCMDNLKHFTCKFLLQYILLGVPLMRFDMKFQNAVFPSKLIDPQLKNIRFCSFFLVSFYSLQIRIVQFL